MAGFEPAIPASERQHTYALDRAATRIGISLNFEDYMNIKSVYPFNAERLVKTSRSEPFKN
jgi:hypothetical protein